MRQKIVLNADYIEYMKRKATRAYYGGNMPLFKRIIRFNTKLQSAILTGLKNSMEDTSWNAERIKI